jgi:DNA-binding GntR family transcriptional regulator
LPERRETAHERIVRTVRNRIECEEWPPGNPIPSEAELCREFGVARGTVRTALKDLENAGLVIAIPARGRFVRSGMESVELIPVRRAQSIVEELRADLEQTRPPGDRFISEAELSERFGVTRYVAKLALSELVSAGLLTPVHGRGHFIPGGDEVSAEE